MITIENSPKFKQAVEILKLFEIDYFLFFTQYKDGRQLKCTTHPKLSKRFVDEGWYHKSVFTKHPDEYSPGFYWYSITEDPEIVEIVEKEYGIYYVINWINPKEDAVEVINFGTHKENKKILNLYLNHNDLLKRFIIYFKSELYHDLCDKNRHLLLPDVFDENESSAPATCDREIIKQFKEATRVKRFELGAAYNNQYLTAKELEVLQWLTTELSSREIGEKMNNSSRTIEQHINNLRDKTGLQKRSELAQFAHAKLLI